MNEKIVKTRKVGNTTVLTVPSQFKVPENVEFQPSINENGDILYKRINNVSEEHKQDMQDFMAQYQPVMDYLKDK